METRPTEFITGIFGSLLLLATSFGWDATEAQVKAILGVVAWIPLVVTWFVAWRRGEKLLLPKGEAGTADRKLLVGLLLIATGLVIFFTTKADFLGGGLVAGGVLLAFFSDD